MVTDERAARRLARVLISDVKVYAGDEVRIGLEKDDIFERLSPQLHQAYVYYVHHVDPDLQDRERIFNHAVVDVLVYGSRAVPTQIF